VILVIAKALTIAVTASDDKKTMNRPMDNLHIYNNILNSLTLSYMFVTLQGKYTPPQKDVKLVMINLLA
jgi:hypothetical protein